MSLDGLVIHALCSELQQAVDGRINKIYQPAERDIVFQIRARGKNIKLLLSANSTYPRVHITDQSYDNPTEPPMFCMLLRKHIVGGIIESIQQIENERILHFIIRSHNELGDLTYKKLIIEIMGRHSNLMLVDADSDHILDSIVHVTPAISAHRVVLPGSVYTAPPEQHKRNPFAAGMDGIREWLCQTEDAQDPSSYVKSFSGISPLSAREIVYRSGLTHASTVDGGSAVAFGEIIESLREGKVVPNIKTDAVTGKQVFSAFQLRHIEGPEQQYDSISVCLESFYRSKAEKDNRKQKLSDLFRFLQNEKNKNERKIGILNKTLENAKDAEKYRIMGECLTSSLYTVQKGDTEAVVPNYYDEQQSEILIPLNPRLTPSENAQKLFRKYNKSKNSRHIVQEQLDAAAMEINYLESVMLQLEQASLQEIEEIREELVEQGYLRNRRHSKKKHTKRSKPVLSVYHSCEGIAIYVGKNNLQNEYLTNRMAHAGDTWLHTKDIPGSHVVIRSASFSEDTLHEAAQLSAYFSKARESSSIPVDYTLIRHVHKPNGAKPGYVIYDHQKTLFVNPDKLLVQALMKQQKSASM